MREIRCVLEFHDLNDFTTPIGAAFLTNRVRALHSPTMVAGNQRGGGQPVVLAAAITPPF